MRGTAVLVVLAAGCGRIAFDGGVISDAPVVDSDAPLGDFSAPVQISELAAAGVDDDPTATGDALEIYFASERLGAAGGFSDLFVARRASLDVGWTAPVPVAELNTTVEEQSPGISPDGLTIYFSSRRTTAAISGTSSNIWTATRATRGDAWSAPALVPELSTTLDEFEPQPDESGLRLVFYRVTSGNRDLFEATRASTTLPWGAPAALASVNTSDAELSPMLADGGLTIYFSSDRASGTPDVHDLFVAHRPELADDFGEATELTSVSSSADDDDPWISTDGRTLFSSSTRSGNSEIYEARR